MYPSYGSLLLWLASLVDVFFWLNLDDLEVSLTLQFLNRGKIYYFHSCGGYIFHFDQFFRSKVEYNGMTGIFE